MGKVAQFEQRGRRSQKVFSPVLQVALLVGVSIHLTGFLIFRVVSSPLPRLVETAPFVEFVSEDSFSKDGELGEQAILFDSAPLFIPTRWNAAQVVSSTSRLETGGKFPDFEPAINLVEELQPSNLPVLTESTVEAPADLLASRFWRFFQDFGRSGESVARLPDPSPVAEVVVLSEASEPAVSSPQLLPADDVPTGGNAALAPVVYYMRVSGSGLLGAPTLGQSSGSGNFDREVLEWLGRPEVRGRLPVGYLRISVFP